MPGSGYSCTEGLVQARARLKLLPFCWEDTPRAHIRAGATWQPQREQCCGFSSRPKVAENDASCESVYVAAFSRKITESAPVVGGRIMTRAMRTGKRHALEKKMADIL